MTFGENKPPAASKKRRRSAAKPPAKPKVAAAPKAKLPHDQVMVDPMVTILWRAQARFPGRSFVMPRADAARYKGKLKIVE
jgi:hypothetical protein